MKNFDLELKQIQLQNEKLIREVAEVHKMIATVTPQPEIQKEFYNVDECAQMKGGCSILTYKQNRTLLPGAGNPKYASYVGGRLCFSRDLVVEWLNVTDDAYPEYARKYGVTLLPEKFMRLAQKAKNQRSVINE